MTFKTRWVWAAMVGGALAISGCRESAPEDLQDDAVQQTDQDPADLSGGPPEGTGGAGHDDEVLGGEAPQSQPGGETTQQLRGEEAPADER